MIFLSALALGPFLLTDSGAISRAGFRPRPTEKGVVLTFGTHGKWMRAGCSRRMTGEEMEDERRVTEDSAGRVGSRSDV